jgi:predicted esterase
MIHKFILGKAGKTFLLLHGTGGDEDSLIPLAREIAPDFSILSVRGKVQENGMNRFFRRFPGGVFDLEDLVLRANSLADFIGKARKDYDLGKIYALGYSNGANIAAAVLLLRPEAIDEAVLLRPQVPIEPKEVPGLRGKRIFISGGERDPLVPREQTDRLASILRDAGAQVTMNWEKGGHEINGKEIQKIGKWLK